jgi:hypothetical protein
MLKRNGQLARHAVPHYPGRLTDAENEAYQTAVASVQTELADLSTIAEALRGVENKGTEPMEAVGRPAEILVGSRDRWQARRSLMNLSQNEVLLCQKGGEFAIIERFPENSPYAKANGSAEITLIGNNERQVLQDYVENERQTLNLLAMDLQAKVSETLTAKHPDQNCKRVVEAITRRCDHEMNPPPTQTQATAPALKPSRGVRV